MSAAKILDGHFHPLDCLKRQPGLLCSSEIAGAGASASPEEWPELAEWAQRGGFPFVLGIHPWQSSILAKEADGGGKLLQKWLSELRRRLEMYSRPAAIGEMGFDFVHCPKEERELQRIMFREQCLMASDFSLPCVIHCVRGFNDLFSALEDCRRETGKKTDGLIHSFRGSPELCRRCVRYGFYISLNASLAEAARKAEGPVYERLVVLSREIPADRIIVESDSPWGAPSPQETLPFSMLLGRLWHMDGPDFAEQCRHNLGRLYRLPPVSKIQDQNKQ